MAAHNAQGEICNADYSCRGVEAALVIQVTGPVAPGVARWYSSAHPAPQELKNNMCLAIPGQVVELVDAANEIAKVEVVGVRRNVNVGLLGDGAKPGDWVLIHVGFALSKVDEEEAQATLALLEQMGAEYEQELAELQASAIE